MVQIINITRLEWTYSIFYFKNLREVYIQFLQEVWLNKQGELQIGDFISSVVLHVHLQAEKLN